MIREIRQALRSFQRQPGLWTLAVITLAIGVGASSSVFALLRNTYDRPLTSLDRERTTVLLMSDEKNGRSREPFSAADWAELRQRAQSFAQLEAYRRESVALLSGSEPQRLQSASISSGVFAMARGAVALGRGFEPTDYRESAPPVAIISDAFWRTQFKGERTILGEQLRLNDEAVTVVGVATPETWFPATQVRVWRPLRPSGQQGADRANRNLQVMGLLRTGTSRAAAETEMRQIAGTLARAYPLTNSGWTIPTLDLIAGLYSDNDKQLRVLLMLLAAGILVLAAVNVANLILARAMLRRQELAIRQSLGASRQALLKHGLADGAVIALPAGVLGLTAAAWASQAVLKLMPALPYPIPVDQPLDAVGIAMGLGTAALAAALFAVMPLLSTRRVGNLREGQTRGATSQHSRRWASGFVAVQTAIAIILITAAGFAVKGVRLLQEQSAHPGFETGNLATVTVSPAAARYPSEQARRALYQDIERAAGGLPSVEQAAMVQPLPVADGDGQAVRLTVEGQPAMEPKDLPAARVLRGSATLAATLQLPLKAGRFLAASDTEKRPLVAVINQLAARRFWPGTDPVGRRVRLAGLSEQWLTVVGVYGDMLSPDVRPQPQVIVALDQFPSARATALVRFRGDGDTAIPQIRRAIQSASPLEPLAVGTMAAAIDEDIKGSRVFAGVLSVLGALALVLGAVGVFSLLSFQVLDRMREIGIRVALGASRERIAGSVVRDGFRLALWGLMLGLPGAWLVARTIAGMLPSLLKAGDWSVASGVAGAIALGTLLACIAPLRRAWQANPADLMRQG